MMLKNIAKQSGYGTYLDCDICLATVDCKQVIVGRLADYVEELERAYFEGHKGKNFELQERKIDEYSKMIERICDKLKITPEEFENEIYTTQRNLDLANLLLAQADMRIKNLESTIEAITNITNLSNKSISEMKKEVIKEGSNG